MSNISKNKNFSLKKIQETMILPLWGRFMESKKEDPLLYDAKAIEIINSIDYNFSDIKNNTSEFHSFAWVVRAKTMDDTVRNFLKKHTKGTIVNIGAGLDTTFERIDNKEVTWYDLDLPDSIEFRKIFIPEEDRSHCISKSVFDYTWFDDIKNPSDNILFLAAGVLMFFKEENLKELFSKLASRFPNSEIFFDTLSEQGLEYSNKMLQDAGMKDSLLSWGINSANEITKWDTKIIVLDEFPYYKHIPRKEKFGSDIIKTIDICDESKATNFYHLKFKE